MLMESGVYGADMSKLPVADAVDGSNVASAMVKKDARTTKKLHCE